MAGAISHVFLWAVLFAVAVPVLALFIREVPLRGHEPDEPTPVSAEEIAAQDVEENPAIASL